MRNEEIVAAARGCVGARFRPKGRDVRFGLDCVGVAAVAFGRPAPVGYAMRGGSAAELAGIIDASGLKRVSDGEPGDLALIAGGLGQFHLAVLTGEGFVHADARLGRVVETPGLPAPIVGLWREVG